MPDTQRTRIARAVHAIARDSGTTADGTDQILVNVDELLDTVERLIAYETRQDGPIAEVDGTPLEELALPARINTAIRWHGVQTIEQLTALTTRELHAVRDLGPFTVGIIRKALTARGLAPADDDQTTEPAIGKPEAP